MYHLPLPDGGKITHVFHLADIHIRDGDSSKSRYQEYLTIIQNLISSLKNHPSVLQKTSVSVLVGDILDHKVKLGGAGCTLFNRLLKGLSDCGPVYIVQGNHDFQQAFPDEPSILDGLLINAPPNVAYLTETGHYVAGSIGFGLVLTRDTLILGSGAGQVEELPPFPAANLFPPEVTHKIALFHGTITGCLLQNYCPSQEGFPKDWIKDYDIHMLGDVHLHQIHGADPLPELSKQERRQVLSWKGKKDVWAYPGSLVQQNFGENIFSNHGYLEWNLSEGIVKVCPVPTAYAKLYIKCMNGDWLAAFPDRRWEPLMTAIEIGKFLHLELRIRNRIRPQDIEHLHEMLRKYEDLSYEITNGLLNNYIYEESELTPTNTDTDRLARAGIRAGIGAGVEGVEGEEGVGGDGLDAANTHILTCEQYNSPETWIQYVDEHKKLDLLSKTEWQKWFRDPSNLLIRDSDMDESIKKTALERNKKITKLTNTLRNQHNAQRTYLKIRYIEWNWLLCYGEDNWLNFDTISHHIAGARARNHKGKSALFDIVCLALFGKPTPLRKGTDGVIHTQKPHGKKACSSIIIDIGKNTFRIYREFYRLESGTTQNVKPLVSRLFNNGFETIAQGSTVNKWVAQSLGDIKDFLLSSMVTQDQDQDFIFASHREQIDILDHSLNLNAYNTFISVLQEARNAYFSINAKHRAIQSKVQNTMIEIDENLITSVKRAYEEGCEKLQLLELQLAGHHLPFNADDEGEALNLPHELIQKYIQAHEKNLQKLFPADIWSPMLQDWENNTYTHYLKEHKELLTLKTKWESHKDHYEAGWKPEMLHTTELLYKNTNDGKDSAPSKEANLLAHEAETILLWKNKWQQALSKYSVSESESDSGFGPILETLRKELHLAQEQYRETCEQLTVLKTKYPPNILKTDSDASVSADASGETFQQWQARVKPLLLPEADFIVLQEWCQENPLSEPPLSEAAISHREQELEKELDGLRVWRDASPADLGRELEITETELKTLEENLKITQAEISTQQSTQRPSEPPVVKEPGMTREECQRLITELQRGQESLPSEKEKLTLLDLFITSKWSDLIPHETELGRLRDRFSQIEQQKYPFNPDCPACQKQPWKLELSSLTEQIDEEEKKVSQLQGHIDQTISQLAEQFGLTVGVIDKLPESALSKMKHSIQKFVSDTQTALENGSLDRYNETLDQWQEYDTYIQTTLKEYQSALEHWISAKDTIIAHQNEAKRLQDQIQTSNDKLMELRTCLNNRDRWDRTRQECLTYRQAWESFKHCQTEHQKYNQIVTIRKEAEIWKIRTDIETLGARETELATKLADLRSEEQNVATYLAELKEITERELSLTKDQEIWKRWCDLLARRKTKEAWEFNQQMTLAENKVQFLHWKLVAQTKKISEQIETVRAQITQQREINNNLLKQLTTHENSMELLRKQQKDAALLGEQIEKLENTYLALDHLIDIFGNFRQWLYQTRVIPKLLDTANNIANLIIDQESGGSGSNEGGECRLTCDVTFGGRKEMILNWKILSHGNEPSIYYGGGFQKIIYGLALRIAIANIGASSIICRQFFIDEGFSSADAEHLERVHVLLNNLLNLYDSIIMVTHLETLKESITCDIFIQRDEADLTSHLQLGDRPKDMMAKQFAHHSAENAPKLNPIARKGGERGGGGDGNTITEIPLDPTGTGAALSNIQALSLKLSGAGQSSQSGQAGPTVLNPNKCQGIKKNGEQCTFKKKPESEYCKKHGAVSIR